MLVWPTKNQWPNERVLEGALLLGLALIFAAVFGFTTRTPFPTVYALVPCVGCGVGDLWRQRRTFAGCSVTA